jgi:hypothetical protein
VGQVTATSASLTGMTANYAVFNSGAGLLATEELLAVSRGGVGAMTNPANKWATTQGSVNPAGGPAAVDAVFPVIVNGSTGVFDPMGASVAPVPFTAVLRNSAGLIEGTSINVTNNAPGATVLMSSAFTTNTVITQCYARTTNNSAQLFTLDASGFAENAAVYLRAYVSLMQSGAGSEHGVYEIAARASKVAGVWTVVAPLVMEVKDLSAGLATSAITVTQSGDELRVTVTNNDVASVDWSGLVHATIEKQLAI